MLELLTYDFMQRSVLAAALVGAVCSVIGVFVVLRGLAFAGAGTAHAAFAGVTLAYLVGLPPLSLAIVFGLATVWITGWVEEKGRMKLDVSIGILYTATMALAIFFLGLMKSYNPEVYGYLFGSVLSVTTEELVTIAGLSVVVLGELFARAALRVIRKAGYRPADIGLIGSHPTPPSRIPAKIFQRLGALR